MRPVLLLLALALAACGPSVDVGEVYEDFQTGARVRIVDVGPCGAVITSLRREVAVRESLITASGSLDMAESLRSGFLSVGADTMPGSAPEEPCYVHRIAAPQIGPSAHMSIVAPVRTLQARIERGEMSRVE